MPKVRLKPRMLDAVQFRIDDPSTHVGVHSAKNAGVALRIKYGEDGYFMVFPTLSNDYIGGNVAVYDGDWIMTDERGHSFPIANEQFEELYEQVEE